MSVNRKLTRTEIKQLLGICKLLDIDANESDGRVSVRTPGGIHTEFEFFNDFQVFRQVLKNTAIKQLER